MNGDFDRLAARAEFLEMLVPVVNPEAVSWMKSQRHHLCVTVFEHSLFVSYISFLIARRCCRGRSARMEAARAGFLHDLYRYDPKVRGSHEGTQCFAHPEHALANSVRLFPWLSEHERNAIVAHMFPLARHLPRYGASWAVTVADKFCAVLEVTKLSRCRFVRKHRLDGCELDPWLVPA